MCPLSKLQGQLLWMTSWRMERMEEQKMDDDSYASTLFLWRRRRFLPVRFLHLDIATPNSFYHHFSDLFHVFFHLFFATPDLFILACLSLRSFVSLTILFLVWVFSHASAAYEMKICDAHQFDYVVSLRGLVECIEKL
ncbi:hypothetical protein VNO78_23316 [Psophocarpus tetragonolobus]|uniref:Uncharacterized protein n=1 Tax=Psophocarpus tetragonolobus TaxID=3891 RepID=A0AAN9XDN7_PSOTE